MDTTLAPQHMEYVRTINNSGEHLLNLINDILDMSKIESDQVSINLAYFNLADLLVGVESLFQQRVKEKGLFIKSESDDSLQALVKADESKLRQVLVNLVGNAVKFTHTGGITIRAHLTAGPPGLGQDQNQDNGEQGLLLSIEVEDSGIGIAPMDNENIFHAFQQGSAGKKLGGTGLGLAISQRFIEIMGGQLAVRSRLGQGSCFEFSIPVEILEIKRDDMATGQLPKLQRLVGRLPGAPAVRILIADDDKVNRLYLRTLLQGAGFVVHEARDGQEAIDLFDSWNPDAVLMDIQMPVVDGYEAIARIKTREQGQLTPVIAVTADAFTDVEAAAKACGADAYVRKPFKAEELFAILGKLMNLTFRPVDSRSNAREFQAVGSVETAGLALLSPALVESLLAAVEAGEMARIKQLIEEVVEIDALLGQALHELAKRYDYKQMMALLRSDVS